uniref:Uncharacterized protein n=1 Tax=Daphnia galeata TaxID=27404 RepID=A0A8J2RJY6_9CRUS|nr:unnamed protein product [Daphnia galeata]
MADPLVYILLNFTKNDELAIGTLEAIAVPKDFHDESFLHQLQQLRAFVGTKKFPIIPGWSLPADSTTSTRSPVQYEIRSCKVITFSEDKDVVVSVRNAMMKTPIGVQKAVAKKSAPKSSATQKRGIGQKAIPPPRNLLTENSPTIIRKSLNISDSEKGGFGCHLIAERDQDKTNYGHESDDNSSVNDHADDQEDNSPSPSDEDEDMIPATPPLPPAKRKRADQSEKSVSKTVSKKNASHSKENDSFVTPKRSKKSSANNSDSHILTSLDVNIFDTPPSSATKTATKEISRRMLEQAKEPVNAELHQQHLRSEYKDEIQELKNQISFLNEQIRDSTYELEIGRDDYNNKIAEKDAIILNLQEEIKSLKELNPEALAKSLNEGLALLHTTLETLTISQVTAQQSRYQLERSESGRTNLVKLHKDYETTVHQNALATAISYGKAGSKKK